MKRFSARLLLTILLSAGSASATETGLPAISEIPGNQHQGTFVWFDLLTHEGDRARSYYEGLFGWTISDAEGFADYSLIFNKGVMIGGVAEIAEEEQPAWLGSFSVNDVGGAAERVTQLGGQILEPVQQIDDRGVMALVEDNAGAVFVLLDTGSRDPKFRPVRTGDWLWIDLFTTNTTVAGDFYKGLAGLKLHRLVDENGSEVDVFISGDTARSGVVEIPWKHVDPIWLPYVRVEDVATTIERSTQLGGQLFYKFEDGAILLDPTGAAFGIQQVSR